MRHVCYMRKNMSHNVGKQYEVHMSTNKTNIYYENSEFMTMIHFYLAFIILNIKYSKKIFLPYAMFILRVMTAQENNILDDDVLIFAVLFFPSVAMLASAYNIIDAIRRLRRLF